MTIDENRLLLKAIERIFTSSILIHSGYGHIFDIPIEITDKNREELKRRINILLAIIRQRANGKTLMT